MPKPKIRLQGLKCAINGTPRWFVRDHTHTIWTNGVVMPYRGMFGDYFTDQDGNFKIDDIDVLQRAISASGGSEGDALQKHAPSRSEYDILTPNTDIAIIKIKQSNKSNALEYYCLAPEPFESNADRKSEFYTIDELSGRRTLIRYSTIEQIDFKVI